MFFCFLICFCFSLHLAHSLLPPLPVSHRNGNLIRRTPASDPSRSVQLIIDLEALRPPRTVGTDTVTAGHGFLYFGGTDVDGPARLEIIFMRDDDTSAPTGIAARLVDYGLDNPNPFVRQKPGRTFYDLPETHIRNDAIMDPQTGAGQAFDTLVEDPIYRTGRMFTLDDNINDCFTYMERFLDDIGVQMNSEAIERFRLQKLWYSALHVHEGWTRMPMNNVVHITITGVNEDDREEAVWNFDLGTSCGKKRDASCTATRHAIPDVTDIDEQSILAVDPVTSNLPTSALDLDAEGDMTSNEKAASLGTTGIDSSVTVVRSGGVLSTFLALSKDTLTKLGVVANDLSGPLFVILDFIGREWKAAALGTANLIAGIASLFAPSGPVGVAIDLVVAVLFVILPGLISDINLPAKITDTQGIIQWKFFGDATHTGNEQCQKANPNCQALYGAGTLSSALGLHNFDAIAFLLYFNLGYAMSIKEIAAAFYVIDPTKSGDGDDKVATINCNNRAAQEAGKGGLITADPPSLCNHPTFSINRSLINITSVGETADKVYQRIISAANEDGDCELLAFPGSLFIASFNITLSGLASDVLCGLNATTPVAGTVVQPGFNIPSSTPFAPLSPENYTCLSYGTTSLCLPPGTYGKQSGLGFEIKDVTSLAFPTSSSETGEWNFTVHFDNADVARSSRKPGSTTKTYTTDQTPPASSKTFYPFGGNMAAIDIDTNSAATFSITSPNNDTGPDPTCCLYTETSYGGDAWCAGVGIADLPSQWQDQARSVNCFSGALAKISYNVYDDWDASAPMVGTEPDLSQQPYGPASGTYSQNVKAVWIFTS